MIELKDIKKLSLHQLEQSLSDMTVESVLDSTLLEGIFFATAANMSQHAVNGSSNLQALDILKRSIFLMSEHCFDDDKLSSFEYSYMVALAKYMHDYKDKSSEKIAELEEWCITAISNIPIKLLVNVKQMDIEKLSIVELRLMRNLKNRLKVLEILESYCFEEFSETIQSAYRSVKYLP